MTRRALMILACLLAGACASSLPEPRPLAKGFNAGSGVLEPYQDGRRHLAAGRYGLAIERFGQALGSDRRSLEALNGLAIAYTRLGRFDVAQAYFERALEIDAFSAPTLNNYGRALIEQGRLQDAKPFLDLALLHAAREDAAVIAANVAGLNQADPPALVVALRHASPIPASDSRRLVRLAANRYRLETFGGGAASRVQADVAPRSTAGGAVLRAASPPAVSESRRQARSETGASPSVVIAVGIGGPGIALASAADLESLPLVPARPAATTRLTAPHLAILPPPTAVSRATAADTGEPS